MQQDKATTIGPKHPKDSAFHSTGPNPHKAMMLSSQKLPETPLNMPTLRHLQNHHNKTHKINFNNNNNYKSAVTSEPEVRTVPPVVLKLTSGSAGTKASHSPTQPMKRTYSISNILPAEDTRQNDHQHSGKKRRGSSSETGFDEENKRSSDDAGKNEHSAKQDPPQNDHKIPSPPSSTHHSVPAITVPTISTSNLIQPMTNGITKDDFLASKPTKPIPNVLTQHLLLQHHIGRGTLTGPSGGKSEMIANYQPWVIMTYGDAAKTKTITLTKYARILRTLRGEEPNSAENSKFRFWVRAKGFRIGKPEGYVAKPADGVSGSYAINTVTGRIFMKSEESGGMSSSEETPPLYVPTATIKDEEGRDIPVYKKVAVVENFFDIIYSVHVDIEGRGAKHAGQKRTYRTITDSYAFLPREAVTRFLLGCTECQRRPRSPASPMAKASSPSASPCPSPTPSNLSNGSSGGSSGGAAPGVNGHCPSKKQPHQPAPLKSNIHSMPMQTPYSPLNLSPVIHPSASMSEFVPGLNSSPLYSSSLHLLHHNQMMDLNPSSTESSKYPPMVSGKFSQKKSPPSIPSPKAANSLLRSPEGLKTPTPPLDKSRDGSRSSESPTPMKTSYLNTTTTTTKDDTGVFTVPTSPGFSTTFSVHSLTSPSHNRKPLYEDHSTSTSTTLDLSMTKSTVSTATSFVVPSRPLSRHSGHRSGSDSEDSQRDPRLRKSESPEIQPPSVNNRVPNIADPDVVCLSSEPGCSNEDEAPMNCSRTIGYNKPARRTPSQQPKPPEPPKPPEETPTQSSSKPSILGDKELATNSRNLLGLLVKSGVLKNGVPKPIVPEPQGIDFSMPITTTYLKHMRSLGYSDDDALKIDIEVSLYQHVLGVPLKTIDDYLK